jgi:hypothetical protein
MRLWLLPLSALRQQRPPRWLRSGEVFTILTVGKIVTRLPCRGCRVFNAAAGSRVTIAGVGPGLSPFGLRARALQPTNRATQCVALSVRQSDGDMLPPPGIRLRLQFSPLAYRASKNSGQDSRPQQSERREKAERGAEDLDLD